MVALGFRCPLSLPRSTRGCLFLRSLRLGVAACSSGSSAFPNHGNTFCIFPPSNNIASLDSAWVILYPPLLLKNRVSPLMTPTLERQILVVIAFNPPAILVPFTDCPRVVSHSPRKSVIPAAACTLKSCSRIPFPSNRPNLGAMPNYERHVTGPHLRCLQTPNLRFPASPQPLPFLFPPPFPSERGVSL